MLTYGCLHPWFNFSEWFIATLCVIQAEGEGHSGARVFSTSVMNGWVLQPLGMELSLEDHDLHREWHAADRVGARADEVDWICRSPRIQTSQRECQAHGTSIQSVSDTQSLSLSLLQGNYGKQTLVWDVIFGTRRERQETAAQYVDWDWHVNVPGGIASSSL